MIETDLELQQLAGAAPAIPGLTFRRLRLPDDLEPLAAMQNEAAAADGTDRTESAEEWGEWFAHPSGMDPARDALVGTLDGRIVAYAQARWEADNDGARDYFSGGEVAVRLRGRGIGRALLRHNLRHLREVAAGHPADVEKRLESWSFDSQARRIRLLESEGFTAVRYFFEMLRPTLDDIPDLPLPDGLEVRPIRPEQYRQIWAADIEAFRDHWGGMDDTDEAFERYFSGVKFRPDLWRVAWDGEEVAGVVMNEVMTAYNDATGDRRGLVAGVSVRRPWRRRGLARALVAQSLLALRDEGMTSAVLGVDAENPTGALGVYETTGFAVQRRGMNYRRPF